MEGVQTMFAKFIDVIQTFLTEPAILIGILVGVGYALDKKTPIKIITGMISAMVGLMMVLFGGFQFSATFKPLAKVIASDEPVREGALFGVFSGHVNVTDGRYVYMRAAQPGREHDIANYTLMPIKINARYDVDELGKLSLAPPFNFTKGLQILRIPAREKYKGVNSFGHLLFDLRDDPQQQHPIHDEAIEARMINLLIRLMKENDAPAEQYRRLGLDVV
ncbi:hypothetical protein BJN50_02880 [Salmonella enterica]|nr:hypothetical protein [Salmonella enterica]EAZ0441322.1 hypothetical protein [Salmonella enterica]EAZ0476168.1 hypothetical protein [Salmonella enterica]EBF4967922.1 hypothetical protein [Salmonella enterica]EBQ5305562.1 hypothetical protein [Salmonella enterica]